MVDKYYQPLISVIIPVYNVEKYLRRCLESVLNQTYLNLEVVLVNDGSTDSSGDICNEYKLKDRRIIVIHKQNGGLVSARKVGVQNAKGAYITYVDSDDWIEKDMYAYMVSLLQKQKVDIVTTGVIRDYGEYCVEETDYVGQGLYDRNDIKNKIFPVLMYTGEFYKSGINVHVYNKLYRKEIVKKNQSMVDNFIRVGEDAALVYPCIVDASYIVISHKCFYHYCLRGDSIMGTPINQEASRLRILFSHLKKIMLEENKNFSKQLNYLMLYLVLLKEPQLVIKKNQGGKIDPFNNLKANSRVIIFGAGKFGVAVKNIFSREKMCDVIGWVDKKVDDHNSVMTINELFCISQDDYDCIVIAVLLETVALEIKHMLIEKGIRKEKIVQIAVSGFDKQNWDQIL